MPEQSPAMPDEVAAAIARYPKKIAKRVLEVRSLIFRVAAGLVEVGPLHETLKWGAPSYLTTETKSGSTVRIGRMRDSNTQYAVFFNCRTSLVTDFRQQFGDIFSFDGNRAIVLEAPDNIPKLALAKFLSMALTYHCQRSWRQRSAL